MTNNNFNDNFKYLLNNKKFLNQFSLYNRKNELLSFKINSKVTYSHPIKCYICNKIWNYIRYCKCGKKIYLCNSHKEHNDCFKCLKEIIEYYNFKYNYKLNFNTNKCNDECNDECTNKNEDR